MELMTYITIIGGIILTVGYLPQIIKLKKTGNTAGISLVFWYLIFSAVTITALNLVNTGAPLVLIIIQAANALLAGAIIGMIYYCRDTFKYVVLIGAISFLLFIGVTSLPIEFSQTVSTVFIVTAYASQLITLIKAESVEGVSAWLYILIALGLGIMATKMFITDVSIHIIVTELVNISLLVACAVFTVYFQAKIKTN